MLNVELLRATQKSIADEANPFEMNDYGCCIAGHIYAILHGTKPDPRNFWAVSLEKEAIAADAGLLDRTLFEDGPYLWFYGVSNRAHAIQAIEDLITTHQPPVCPARRSSKVAPRAKADITAEEVGELVGVL